MVTPSGFRRCLPACLGLVLSGRVAIAGAITLGLVAPPADTDEGSIVRGAQLAVADAGASGIATVKLEIRRRSGQWGTVGNEAVDLACGRHVDAMITPSDGAASHLILQVASRTRVPVATLCADSSVTNAGVPWVVRIVPRTDREAVDLFTTMRGPDRSPLHWWAVTPRGRPGRSIRRDLAEAARATATLLDRTLEDGPKADFASVIHEIVVAAPGGVLLWLPPAEAGMTAARLRSAGYVGSLAGPGVLASPEFLDAAGSAATGVLVSEFQRDDATSTRQKAFDRHFRRQFGTAPDFAAAAAYDAACVLIEMLRRRTDLPPYRRFPLVGSSAGVTGGLHFDDSGNRSDALQVFICREGKFSPLSSRNGTQRGGTAAR